jgi:hypothetical protein
MLDKLCRCQLIATQEPAVSLRVFFMLVTANQAMHVRELKTSG